MPAFGQRHTRAARRKISEQLKLYWELLPEAERAVRGAVLSMALRGRPTSEKHKHGQRLSAALRGRRLSDQHRQRLSAAKKAYWQRRKSQQ